IDAPARLHLGFVDLNGSLGRNFGSMGLCIDSPSTRLRLSRHHELSVSGPDAGRAAEHAAAVLKALDASDSVRINIERAIPAHVGLGSGTQLALAVSAGVARLLDRPAETSRLAGLTARGLRSGIGIGAFEMGGFIVDGGRGEETVVPPVISRMDFPEAWRILLIFDDQHVGLSGRDERSAFAALPPMTDAVAARLCRIAMMQMLPAVRECRFTQFSMALNEVQNTVGDHFARFQGGRYTSDAVGTILNWLLEQGVIGVGQSSWGPTGFALLPNEQEAEQVLGWLESSLPEWFAADSRLRFEVVGARNHGADITPEMSDESTRKMAG
ncbi:MAG: GHMP kinase, partial [Gammaproteobacteria bacterium]|nr:GHMP kinase [Gammaproteobacteria bacterium]